MYLIKSIFRSDICKVNLDENQKIDYIYSLRYWDNDAVQPNSQPMEVTDTTISCNLDQRQRSSQQILDLADYLQMHQSTYPPITPWSRAVSQRDEMSQKVLLRYYVAPICIFKMSPSLKHSDVGFDFSTFYVLKIGAKNARCRFCT